MNQPARILIVDDEPAIRFFLAEELDQVGYSVQTAASGEEAVARLQDEPADLVLLDLKMPGMDGLQVMESLERQPAPPIVIVLTAHASVDSAIGALRRGAFDYLRKPCTSEALLASVARGLVKREEDLRRQGLARLIEESARQLHAHQKTPVLAQPEDESRFLSGRGLLLDRARMLVTRQGKPVDLTPTELRLLVCLMERPDQPVSFSQMAQAVHGTVEDAVTARQSLTTHLWRLKRKLGRGPDGQEYVVSVRGHGYTFVSRECRG